MNSFVMVNSPTVLYRLGLKLCEAGLSRSFYTAPGLGAGFKNMTNIKRSRIFGKLIAGGKKKKWCADFRLPKQPGVVESPIATKGPNASRRVNVLNALFMEHITDVMSTGDIGTRLEGHGIEITKVQVSCDYTFLNIYWLVADCTAERDKEAEKLLMSLASPIRQYLTSLRLMGHVPKVVFVRDKSYTLLAEVERRLAIADFGPPDELCTQECEQESVTEELAESADEKVDPDDMRQDIFGLDRRRLITQVIQQSKKARADHRTSDSPYVFHEMAQPGSHPSCNSYSTPVSEVGNDLQTIKDFMKARQIEKKRMMREAARKMEGDDSDENEGMTGYDDDDNTDEDSEENDDYDDTNPDWYKREL